MKIARSHFIDRFKFPLSDKLFQEYLNLRTAYWLNKPIEVINYAGRFSEVVIAGLTQLKKPSQNIDINKIKFNKSFNDLLQLSKKTPEEELLYLVIPQVLKSVYTIRSKKRVVHFKINKPEMVDAELVLLSCNWVLAQLASLFHEAELKEVEQIVALLMRKKIPSIETFQDGSTMIIKKGLSYKDKILLVLYQRSKRLTVEELERSVNPPKKSYINTYLQLLYKNLLVHINEKGATITKNGIKRIEKNKEKFF